MDVDVDAIPRREPGMIPIEVMTSESQERMLAIVEPGAREAVEEVCRRWEIEAAVIGIVRDADADGVGRLRVRAGFDGPVLADVPARSLAEDAPKYYRPMEPPAHRGSEGGAVLPEDGSGALLAMLVDSSWISEQYDHQLFLNTVLGPGEADAALLRLTAPGVPPTAKAIGLSVDGNPRWCAIDPRRGTAATVAESALNVACVGATPAAVVDCLNFGNPEHPTVMWQLSEAVDGMRDACLALGLPVIGGNVSLYNESDGIDIDPTPVVGVVGVLDEIHRRPPGFVWRDGDTLVLIGPSSEDLTGSAYGRGRSGFGDGLPALDLELHARIVRFIAQIVAAEASAVPPALVHAIHDVSDGGLALCLAELSIASDIGCTLDGGTVGSIFSEASSRVVVGTPRPADLIEAATAAGIPAAVIGRVGGARLVAPGVIDVAVNDLAGTRSARIPRALGELDSE
jgi:phosphoribosylformylglycinamidine synthase